MRSFTLVITLTLVAGLVGCYDPEMGDTPFKCSPTYSVDCPEGFFCHEINYGGKTGKVHVCVKEAPPDVGVPDRKIMTDAEILPSKEGPVYMDGAMVFPAGNCADQSSEPNNSAGKATPLATKSALVPGWEICYKFDIDQFTFKVKTGQKLTVKAKFTHSKGDLDMAMTGTDGKIVSSSRSETDNEEVSWTATSDGSFVVGVWGAAQPSPKSSPAVNQYDLEITVD